ncbi:MAG: SusC/RagA family TonB-linked outer membrane protein [Tannerella sp.]|jgi:TonB-linked SusC/RagA family outer membrane protein|nr:SusC/RagA family TonB-linked outer membrane protein [Tannerella sp.]
MLLLQHCTVTGQLYTDDTKGKYSTWSDANTDANTAAREGLVYNLFNKDWNSLYDANGKLSSGTEMFSGYNGDLDWFEPIERTGSRSHYNLSARGGSKKATYYASVGYLKEEGYTKASGVERITGNMKVDLTPAKWFKMGISMNGSDQVTSRMSGSAADNASSYINPFYFSRNMAPIYPVHLHDTATGAYVLDDDGNKIYDSGANGELIRPQSNARHIAWETELDKDRLYRTALDGTAYADISFLNDFVLSVKGSLNNTNQSRKTYNNSVVGDGAGQGRMGQYDHRHRTYLLQQLLTWNRTFNGVHHVDALIGHEAYSYGYQYGYQYKTDEKFAGVMELSNFSTMSSMVGYQNKYNNEGYFFRGGYNYDQKYFGEFSFRRDGSSRFYKDNRWGNFWSAGGSWVMSREDFIKQISWIDHLKLRAAYGEVGSDGGNGRVTASGGNTTDISYYAWMELYYSDKNGGKGALYKYQNEAKDVNWEKTKSMSVAIESRLFKRANFTIEYYDKTSEDLLFNVTLPSSMGATEPSSSTGTRPTVLRNFGSVSNKGLEIGFDVDIIQKKDLIWNFGANFNFQNNKVKKLPEEYGEEGYISGIRKYLKGHSMYSFWLYKFVGIDREDGRSLYVFNDETFCIDKDGYTGPGAYEGEDDGRTKMSAANYKIIDGVAYVYNTTYSKKGWSGDAIPDLWGSFSTSLTYKNFTLSGLFTYQIGAKIYDYSYASLMGMTATPSASHRDVLKSWTPEQAGTGIDPNGIPALNTSLSSYNNAQSDRFLVDGDYLAIKSITLGYSLPKTVVNKIGIKGATVSASVENLVTFTKLQGISPQQSFTGYNDNGYLPARVMSIGLNVKF